MLCTAVTLLRVCVKEQCTTPNYKTMKKILGVGDNGVRSSTALLLLRSGLGLLMLVHGVPKMMMLFNDGPIAFPPVLGMTAEVSLLLTVFAEVLCSVLIVAGLATRFAAVPLAITMFIAVFVIHGADPFANKELAIHYLLGYIVLMIAGSGKYSFDYLMLRNSFKTYHPEIKPEDPTLSIYQ